MNDRRHWKKVLADDLAMMGLPPTWKFRYRFSNRVAVYVRHLRIAEYWRGRRRNPIGRLIYLSSRLRYERQSERLGMDVALGVFGAGLSIAHLGAITVNGGASIGERCRIHPGVLVGAHRGAAPVIGDDVFIGPNVVVLGGVTIGNGSVIAAGSVVRSSVPTNSLVHPPASILKESKGGAWALSNGLLGPSVEAGQGSPNHSRTNDDA